MARTNSKGTSEYDMGASGVHPGSNVPPGFNWAAYWDGHDDARAPKPTASYSYTPPEIQSFQDPHYGGAEDQGGIGAIFLFILIVPFWKYIACMLVVALLIAGLYGLWQIREDIVEAIDWLAGAICWGCRRMAKGCCWMAKAAGTLARLIRARAVPPLRSAATTARQRLGPQK